MYLKVRKVVKEAVFILALLLALLFLVNILLHFIPKSRTPIDITLNGNEIGALGDRDPFLSSSSILEPVEIGIVDTVPITIKGYYVEYFFDEPKLNVEISSFDGLTNFKPADMNAGPGTLIAESENGYDRLRTTYHADYNGRPILVTVHFTKDFNNWLFTAYSHDAFTGSNQRYGQYAASIEENSDLDYFSEVFYPVDFSKGWDVSFPVTS